MMTSPVAGIDPHQSNFTVAVVDLNGVEIAVGKVAFGDLSMGPQSTQRFVRDLLAQVAHSQPSRVPGVGWLLTAALHTRWVDDRQTRPAGGESFAEAWHGALVRVPRGDTSGRASRWRAIRRNARECSVTDANIDAIAQDPATDPRPRRR